MTPALKNADGLTDSTITMWDDSNGQLVNPISLKTVTEILP